jgi:hypothetical protein
VLARRSPALSGHRRHIIFVRYYFGSIDKFRVVVTLSLTSAYAMCTSTVGL